MKSLIFLENGQVIKYTLDDIEIEYYLKDKNHFKFYSNKPIRKIAPFHELTSWEKLLYAE